MLRADGLPLRVGLGGELLGVSIEHRLGLGVAEEEHAALAHRELRGIHSDLLAKGDARDAARERLNQAIRGDILAGFSASLNSKHDVAIKEAVIARYFMGNGALQ